jgi:hypothetical protein
MAKLDKAGFGSEVVSGSELLSKEGSMMKLAAKNRVGFQTTDFCQA